jgi:hypothetical protein
MKSAVLLFLSILAGPAVAQDLPVSLPDGASWTLTAEHTRRAEGMGEALNWSLTTTKRLTWHAGRRGKPATLTVTPISAVAGEGSPPEIARARSLAIPATLTVDESLAPGEVVNRDEVRAEFLRLVPDAANGAPAMIDVSSKAMIASELATASRGQGFGLKLNQPISADASMPNPLGGPALRAVETVELASFDKERGRAVIKWRQALDPGSFKASIAAMLAAMAKDKANPAKIEDARATLETATMTNRTECLYEIDIRTGLASRGDCQIDTGVTVQGKSQKVSEHWTISQTEPGTT